VTPVPEGPAQIGTLTDIDPGAAKRPLSRQVVGIIERAIRDAAAAPDLVGALEIGYRAFGASACTAAAKEGVSAFLARRKPDFTKTG
jgi:enoyl-CoA hydratase/3-hydroxyacyl-CoA dehydrogenase